MTVRLTFDRPEFAHSRASVWLVGKHGAEPATVRLDERGQGYADVAPDGVYDVVLRSNLKPPEAARVQMSDTDADFDDVQVRADGSLGQRPSTNQAPTPYGNLGEIRDELVLIRKTIAAHGLATTPHSSEASLSQSLRFLARIKSE